MNFKPWIFTLERREMFNEWIWRIRTRERDTDRRSSFEVKRSVADCRVLERKWRKESEIQKGTNGDRRKRHGEIKEEKIPNWKEESSFSSPLPLTLHRPRGPTYKVLIAHDHLQGKWCDLQQQCAGGQTFVTVTGGRPHMHHGANTTPQNCRFVGL